MPLGDKEQEKESDCQERDDDTSVRGNVSDSTIQRWDVNSDHKATGEVCTVG